MILDRTRRRRHGLRAFRVIRSPTLQEHQRLLAETSQAQPVVVLPAELPPRAVRAHDMESDDRPAPPPSPSPPLASPSLATTQRVLVSLGQRARHLMSNRSVVEALGRTRHQEMLEEIEQMKRTVRTLQNQIEATTSNVEAMENLIVQLRRITSGLHEPSNETSTLARSSFNGH
ncbi:uncharacterized protein IUM83_04515 [Phytophthora cinnamomi]|uniref:uncharacterized protein n=1 Tax=Phytophthora cinnamomi TaxID=4785 RepID=UPI003559E10C|nr:hypothetical protein IUM83_04515 [Phytophthora cinnamomi]